LFTTLTEETGIIIGF